MASELAEMPAVKTGILMSVTEETIANMATEYGSLRINGVHDKKGFAAVNTARLVCVKARGVLKKEHAERKEVALRVCQTLDAAKRDLTAKIEAIESRLEAEIQAVEDEKARIEKSKQDELHTIRKGLWESAGGPPTDRAYLLSHSKEVFESLLADVAEKTRLRKQREAEEATAAAERKRLADEQEEANRKERARLQAEREEFQRQQAEAETERKRLQAIEDEARAKERRELEAQQAALKAEQDRLAKIEADRLEVERLERVKAEAAEQARIETEQRLAHEAAAKEQTRLAEEAAKAKAEKLRPTKDKLTVFADRLLKMETPDLDAETEKALYVIINTAVAAVRKLAKELT